MPLFFNWRKERRNALSNHNKKENNGIRYTIVDIPHNDVNYYIFCFKFFAFNTYEGIYFTQEGVSSFPIKNLYDLHNLWFFSCFAVIGFQNTLRVTVDRNLLTDLLISMRKITNSWTSSKEFTLLVGLNYSKQFATSAHNYLMNRTPAAGYIPSKNISVCRLHRIAS